MKKGIFLIASIGVFNYAIADHTINLVTTNLTCGKYHITMQSTPTEVNKNCKIIKSEVEHEHNGIEQKLKFYTDDGMLIKCKFLNNRLHKCEIDD